MRRISKSSRIPWQRERLPGCRRHPQIRKTPVKNLHTPSNRVAPSCKSGQIVKSRLNSPRFHKKSFFFISSVDGIWNGTNVITSHVIPEAMQKIEVILSIMSAINASDEPSDISLSFMKACLDTFLEESKTVEYDTKGGCFDYPFQIQKKDRCFRGKIIKEADNQYIFFKRKSRFRIGCQSIRKSVKTYRHFIPSTVGCARRQGRIRQ